MSYLPFKSTLHPHPSFYPNSKVLLKTKPYLTNSIFVKSETICSFPKWPRECILGLLDAKSEIKLDGAQKVSECVY